MTAQDLQPKAPLEGVRILDLSRFIAGPYCTALLADMGADVIKVERPGGEDSRRIEPTYHGQSIYPLALNRNKRAVTLNTRSARGREVLRRLATWADVVVENYRPGTMERMGLGFADLRRLNPRVILTSISAVGQSGPDREMAMFDGVAQARSGFMSRNVRGDEPPLLTGTFIGDYLTAAYAALGTVLAVHHRERTGVGQHVDVALLDSLFTTLGTFALYETLLGTVPTRNGNRDLYTAPANVFAARDGHVYIHAGTQALFARFVAVIDRPELAADPRFQSVADRMAHVDEIEQIVAEWAAGRDGAELERILATAGIPCGRVADVGAAVRDPQLQAREMLVPVEHPLLGALVVPGLPIKLSESPGAVRSAPPLAGEHNHEIYGGLLGLSDAELHALEREGVI